MGSLKFNDSSSTISIGSRADNYWKSGYKKYFEKTRPGLKIPEKLKTNDLSVLIKSFNLKDIGYGNWLSVEDRINYTYALILALYDLNKVLNFKFNIGFGLLAITFGARGKGRALAHYEPDTNIINITRYSEGKRNKELRFFTTGGLGSLAHEYGHFLDYFAGSYLAKDSQIFSLSNGHSLSKYKTNRNNIIRDIMDNIIQKIIWRTPGKEISSYYKRLVNTIENSKLGDYWIRRNELFARAFEVYVMNKLQKQAISNLLLTSKKYNAALYLKDSEIIELMLDFDNLLFEIRKKIN